jgi:raffinose/stachyose/melibiose transport system substrate-binding protein
MQTARILGVLFAISTIVFTACSNPASSASISAAPTNVVATAGSESAQPSVAAAPVEIVWWNNASFGPTKDLWQTVADEYHAAHPNVTITIVPIPPEETQLKVALGLQSDDPPDLFQAWGGGELTEQVKAGKVMDITEAVAPWIDSIGGSAAGWQVSGKQYGIPYSLGILGFWYNKDLFAQAGITTPPTTIDEFHAAIGKLKAAGITPISVGGKDKWPVGFFWSYYALRICSKEVMQESTVTFDFSDPCWTEAGVQTQKLIDAEPFQEGFIATSYGEGASSSAGLMANGKSAMELQGQWHAPTLTELTPDKNGLGDKLGWFAFPAVPGGAGTPDAALGAGDGFACSWKAPVECADFLEYFLTPDVQSRFGALNLGLPVAKGSESSVPDPSLAGLIDFRGKSSFVQQALDVAYPPSVGQTVNDATYRQFAGELTAEEVVKAIADSAAN